MKVSVTGKKREDGVPEHEQHTITEQIETADERMAWQLFAINNPGYEVVRTEILEPDKKAFILTYNAGSLSGSGQGGDVQTAVMAYSEADARFNFDNDPVNQRYGRRIKSIREV